MLNIIVKAVFFIVGKIGDIVLLPITALINAVLPGLSINFDYIFNYLNMGFSYIPFFLKTLIIPPACVQIVLLVFTSYLAFIVGIHAYQFIVKVYEKFKP